MAAQGPTLPQIKSQMKATWMAGDFGKIAEMSLQWGEEFVQRLGLKPGMKVLDIGCGTGNQAIPAARTGAEVTGVDIATNLLEQARRRAQQENLEVRFLEGDAEELPFDDQSFDVVYSMFGAMFAPRPELVAAEMKRVVKPGGLIAMGNWTPEGVPGQLFAISGKYAPPPPGMQPPYRWGVESVVRERFGDGVEIVTKRRMLRGDFDVPPAQVVDRFREYFGPVKMLFERLGPEDQKRLSAEMEQVFHHANRASTGGTSYDSEFLEIHARKTAQ